MSAGSSTSYDGHSSHKKIKEYSDDYDEKSSENGSQTDEAPSDTRVLNPFHNTYLKHLRPMNFPLETRENDENPRERIKSEINTPDSIKIESDDDETLFSFSEVPPTDSGYPQNIINVDNQKNSSMISSSLIFVKTNSPRSIEQEDFPVSENASMPSTLISDRRNPSISQAEVLIKQEDDSISEKNPSINSTVILNKPNPPVLTENELIKQENDLPDEPNSSMVSTVINERNNPQVSRENELIKLENRSRGRPQSPEVEMIGRNIVFDDRNSTDSDSDSDPNEFEPDDEIDEVGEENDANLGNLEDDESQRRESRANRVPKVNKYYYHKPYGPDEDKAMFDVLIEKDLIEFGSRLSSWKRIAEMDLARLKGRKPRSLHNRFMRFLLENYRDYVRDPYALERFRELKEYVEETKLLG